MQDPLRRVFLIPVIINKLFQSLFYPKLELMNEVKRKKIMTVFGGFSDNLPLLHEVDHFVRSEQILDWLIKNNIVGKKFFDFYASFEFSKIRFGKFVLSRVEKSKKLHLIAGKDLL